VVVWSFTAQWVAASQPSGGRWQQIQQPQFTLIFQAAIASEAERVADSLNQYLANHLNELPLERPLKPISLVLHAAAHSSNGNVGMLPYGSNWYNKPAPFSRLEWYDGLAVHEGRHIVQFNQLNDLPLAQAAALFAGERGLALVALAVLPSWFLEGDAVVAETTQTDGGRGRVAAFDLWFRTDALNHPPYSYDRAMLGTGLDRVPYLSPYVLGYFLTAYLRTEYGSDLFERSLQHLGAWPGFNFDGAIAEETGKSLSAHYHAMMIQLTGQWQHQLGQLNLTPVTPLSIFHGSHWQSLYPLAIADDLIIAAQVDAAQGGFLVAVQDQHVTRLTTLPSDVTRSFSSGSKTRAISTRDARSCWIAELPDKRKPLQETGDLFCWQPSQGLEQLTQGDKLTSVSQSTDGFVAHRFNSDRSSELVLLDSNGQLRRSLALPAHSLAFDIQSTASGWVFVLAGSIEDGIYSVDRSLSRLTRLKAADDESLRAPLMTRHWLVYQSDRTGIDQLMARSRVDGREFQIASRPFGSYYPTWDPLNRRLVFADYTAQGQVLVSIAFSDSRAPEPHWIASPLLADATLYAQALVHEPVRLAARTDAYVRTDYPIGARLWNPHSWWFNANNTALMGSLQSDDVLAKLGLTLAGGYHFEARDWLARIDAQYRTEPGTILALALDKQIMANLAVTRSVQVGISENVAIRRGAFRQQLLPALGLRLAKTESLALAPTILAGIDYQRVQDKPTQAIDTPLGIYQNLAGQLNVHSAQLDLLSRTGLTVRGLSARQALNAGVALQYLQSSAPLMLDSPLFGTPSALGVTLRGQLDYRVNLGAVGWPLTSLAYWRNTELSFNGRAQSSPEAWNTALGVTLQPSLNLLRNSSLILNPGLAFYYLPQSDTVQLQVSITVGGF
jgi:hypothetical protein